MFRLSIIFAVLCTILLEVRSAENDEYSTHGEQAASVFIGDDYFTVFKSNSRDNSFIKVKSSDPSHKLCTAKLDHQKDSTVGDIYAVALANRKIVVWGKQKQIIEHRIQETSLVYKLFIVDPFDNCRCIAVDALTDVVPEHQYHSLLHPTVIPYDSTFDIFLLSQKKCNPCRYNDAGEKQHLDKTIPAVENSNLKIRVYKNVNNHVFGYIAAYQLKDETTLLKLFDENYVMLQEKHLTAYKVDQIVTNYGLSAHTGMYDLIRFYDGQNVKYNLVCYTLDGSLDQFKTTFSTALPVDARGGEPTYDLKIDTRGNLYVIKEQHLVDNEHAGKRILKFDVQKLDRLTGGRIGKIETHTFPDQQTRVQFFVTEHGKFYFVLNMREATLPSKPSQTFTKVEQLQFEPVDTTNVQ